MKLTKTDIGELETALAGYKLSLVAKPETSLEEVKLLKLRREWACEFETRLRKALAGIIREEKRIGVNQPKEELDSLAKYMERNAHRPSPLPDASDLTPPSEMPNLSEIERNNPE